jgi:hypothetical protein
MRRAVVWGAWRRWGPALAALAILAAAWLPGLDELARTQADAGWKRALATFATARALNAVISVAQGTEVAAQPGGVGVSLAPGQVLDPINDLVEQFSNLMLYAAGAFGAQLLLIRMGAWWPLTLLLTLAVVAWALLAWRGRPLPWWLARGLLVLLAVRFLVPLTAIANEAVYRHFMSGDYQQAQQSLAVTTMSAGEAGNATAPADENLWARLQRWGKSANPSLHVDALNAKADAAVEHIVRLIVVFTLQTVVLPLLLGWLLLRLARAAFVAPPPAQRT